MSTEKITYGFHQESLEGVEAVLKRMVKSLGPDIGEGYAEALDVSKNTIKTWFHRGEVPMRFLTGFAKKHGVSLDYLRFGGALQLESTRGPRGYTEAVISQAVLDAVDLLSLDAKIDAQQLARAVVKLCSRHGGQAEGQKQTNISVGANHGQVAEGGLVNNGPVSFGGPGGKK